MFRRKKENFTRIFHGSLALAGGLLLAWQTTVLAAANLQDVRFHSGADHDRVVFDLTETPLYTVRESADGQQITLDFTEVGLRHFQNQAFQSKRIKAVSYRQQRLRHNRRFAAKIAFFLWALWVFTTFVVSNS